MHFTYLEGKKMHNRLDWGKGMSSRDSQEKQRVQRANREKQNGWKGKGRREGGK